MNNDHTSNVRQIALFSLIVALVFSNGCTTQSRLGYIIPANRNSDSAKNEIVRLDFLPNEKPKTENDLKSVIPVAGLASVAAKAVFDFVKGELEREAERYEAEFSKVALLSTEDVENGDYLVLTRWVDSRDLTYQGNVTKQTNYTEIVSNFLARMPDSPSGSFPLPWPARTTTTNELAQKQLAFMFVARIDPFKPGAGSRAFKLYPHFLWAWQSKAKVVDLNLTESWKVWQVLGAIFFKTDNQVRFKIEPQIKALAQSTNGLVMVASISPSEDPIVNQTHNLNTPKEYFLGDNSGALVGIPFFEARPDKEVGYFSIRLAVHESDNSNIRKVLTKGAEAIGKNKETWADKVSSIFGQ